MGVGTRKVAVIMNKQSGLLIVSVASLCFLAVPANRVIEQSIPPSFRTSLYYPAPRTIRLRRPQTDADRQRQFEAEYGFYQPRSSPVLRSIQAAKYQVDTTVFSLQQLVEHLHNALSFEYRQGQWQHAALDAQTEPTDSRVGFFGNPRVNVDFNPLPGKTYLGLRVVIPFGS